MKGLFNFLLSVVLFVAIIVLTGTIAVRVVISSNNLSKIAEAIIEPEDDKKELVQSLFGSADVQEEFLKYIDNKEFKEVFGDFFHQFIMYKAGLQEESIDTSKVKSFLKNCAEKYNKENEDKLTDENIDEIIASLNKEIGNEKPDEEVSKVFNVIFSKTLLFVSVLVIVIVFGLLDFINKKINTPIIITGINILIVGIILFGLYGFLNSVSGDQEVVEVIKEILISPLKLMSFVEIGVGIVLIVVSKKVKDNRTEFKEEKEVTN